MGHGADRASYFLLPSIGIMLAVLVMGVLGAFSQQATGNWNIALLGAHISGWGFVAALGAGLAVLHTNAMNLYPSTVALLVAASSSSAISSTIRASCRPPTCSSSTSTAHGS